MKNRMVYFIVASCLVATLTCCEEQKPPPSSVPPSGATFVSPEVTPTMVVESVLAAKGDDARRAAAASWADQWIPSPGWEGTIERLSEEQGRTVAWIKYPASAIIGGSFLVGIDVVEAGNRDLSQARSIEYTGRIEKVEFGMVGPIPELKIAIRNGKILKADGR